MDDIQPTLHAAGLVCVEHKITAPHPIGKEADILVQQINKACLTDQRGMDLRKWSGHYPEKRCDLRNCFVRVSFLYAASSSPAKLVWQSIDETGLLRDPNIERQLCGLGEEVVRVSRQFSDVGVNEYAEAGELSQE